MILQNLRKIGEFSNLYVFLVAKVNNIWALLLMK